MFRVLCIDALIIHTLTTHLDTVSEMAKIKPSHLPKQYRMYNTLSYLKTITILVW